MTVDPGRAHTLRTLVCYRERLAMGVEALDRAIQVIEDLGTTEPAPPAVEDIKPESSAPPYDTGPRIDFAPIAPRPPATMVPSGLPRQPVDHQAAREAAFTDPRDDLRKG